MTCIVGIAEEGKVYVGGDSACVSRSMVLQTGLAKVFKTRQFLIGYTSSFRMGQILQYHLRVKAQSTNQSDLGYMVQVFAEAVRAMFKERGFAQVENNEEKGGQFIVGYKGRVYEIDTDFQVNWYRNGLAVCGEGQEFALGALMALETLPPKERIQRALEIAAHYCSSVSEPFVIEEV